MRLYSLNLHQQELETPMCFHARVPVVLLRTKFLLPTLPQDTSCGDRGVASNPIHLMPSGGYGADTSASFDTSGRSHRGRREGGRFLASLREWCQEKMVGCVRTEAHGNAETRSGTHIRMGQKRGWCRACGLLSLGFVSGGEGTSSGK